MRVWTSLRLALIVLLVLSGGCRPAPPESAPSPATSDELAGLLARISGAVEQDRGGAFTRQLSDRDRGFAPTAEMIFDNLVRLPLTELDLSGTGRTAELKADRAELLGPRAYVAEVAVRWAVAGDPAASEQKVWLTVRPEAGRLRWAGVTDGPAERRPTPLWWLEPVRAQRSDSTTVIGGAGVDVQGWAAAADDATRAVRDGLTGGDDHPTEDWNRRLTAIVPSNNDLLEQMLGAAAGTHEGLAAISWVDGPDATTAPIRIMINPGAELSSEGRQILLTHEAVHVATRSPSSPAPTWLVEGFADLIAYSGRPEDQRAAAARPVLDRVRTSGPPRALPAEHDFSGSGADLEYSYAAAWSLCRYLEEQYGRAKVIDFYTQVDESATGEIAPAAADVFGVDSDELLAGWQGFLTDWAAER